MCGIVGFIKKRSEVIPGLKDVMDNLLFFNSIRGKDSTGVFVCGRSTGSGEVNCISEVFKKDVPGWDFVNFQGYSNTVLPPNALSFFVGHNRAATRGKVTQENSHPFTVKHIRLCHNGSLHGHAELGGSKWYEVDSHAITAEIALNGIKECANKMNGAWSLVWQDMNNNTLNFYRNKERPMFFVDTKNAVFFGSEPGIICAALSRNNIEILDIVGAKEHVHYCYTFDPMQSTIVSLTETEIIPERKPVFYSNNWYGKYGNKYSSYLNEDEYYDRLFPPSPYSNTKIPHETAQLGMNCFKDDVVWKDQFPAAAVIPQIFPNNRIVFCIDNYVESSVETYKAKGMYYVTGKFMLREHEEYSIIGYMPKEQVKTAFNNRKMIAGTITNILRSKHKKTIQVDKMGITTVPDPVYHRNLFKDLESFTIFMESEGFSLPKKETLV